MLGIGDVGTAVSSRVRSFGKKDVSKRKKAFILGGFCTAQVLDVTTTHIGLSQGRQELNGAAAWIINATTSGWEMVWPHSIASARSS